MTRVWRIVARRHARRAYSGEGARLYGGRWNAPGVAVVYTAGSLSLAALELFVHLDPEELPEDLVSVAAAIPDDVAIERLHPAALPRHWRQFPAPEAVQKIGTAWAASGRTAVLAVPSAVIPEETNYLLNPAHPQFAAVRMDAPKPFRFDARMGK